VLELGDVSFRPNPVQHAIISPWDYKRRDAWQRLLYQRLMTAIIGFVCGGNLLVIATDSQMGHHPSTGKNHDYPKLAKVSFADGSQVLIAKSGGLTAA
jgi:hypothetical protein